MSKEKRYFWLRLHNDFFEKPRIKKLRKLAGGDKLIVIYLKLMLRSLEDGGKVYFDGIEKNIYEELALILDEETDDIKLLFGFLISVNLLECDNETYEFIEAQSMIASETSSARRVRKHRAKKELLALQSNTLVTKSNESETESNNNISINDNSISSNSIKDVKKKTPTKNAYGELKRVLLTDAEYEKLQELFPQHYKEYIQNLDYYIEGNNKRYKSHYAVIRQWLNREGIQPRVPTKATDENAREILDKMRGVKIGGDVWETEEEMIKEVFGLAEEGEEDER